MSNKVLDLFCGCGGLSLGFKKAGYDIIGGVDFDKSAIETYGYNFPEAISLNEDISKLNFNQLKTKLEKNPDIIIGGPPCQGFSYSGARKEDDPRNKLFYYFFNMVREFGPKAFLMENVPGILFLDKGNTKDEIVRLFTEIGYNLSFKVLDAVEYGIPQHRKRTIFIGLKKGVFTFPDPTHGNTNDLFLNLKPFVTCAEAWEDIPPVEGIDLIPHIFKKKDYCDFVQRMREQKDINTPWYNHKGTRHSKGVLEAIRHVPEGGNWKDLPDLYKNKRKFKTAFTRYSRSKPSYTVDTGHRQFFHYKFDRNPTVRENARLQSFPDSFIFTGSRTQQDRQVGNAVPPLLAQVLALEILKYLN